MVKLMKKVYLVLTAMLCIFKVSNAQMLTARYLGTDNDGKVANSKIAPMTETVEDSSLWVSALPSFDPSGNLDVTGRRCIPENFTVSYSLNGDTLTVSGLMDVTRANMTSQNSLKGFYDREAKTVTFNAPMYDDSKPTSTFTEVGKGILWGQDYTYVLFAGNFTERTDKPGEYSLITVDNLVFDVSDDMTEMTARTGYCLYGFSAYYKGFFNHYRSAKLFLLPEEAKLNASPDTVTIEGASASAGATITKYVYLSNVGKASTHFSYTIEGEDFQVNAADQIEALSTEKCSLVFTPKHEGEYLSRIKFVADNGSESTVVVKANVGPAPDFSAIVKEGDIVFSNDDDGDPFTIDESITGYPVAVSTNSGDDSKSILHIICNVPNDKVGVLSWKGLCHGSYFNGVTIDLDDITVLENLKQGWDAKDFTDNISSSLALAEGNHIISLTYTIGNDSYSKGWVKDPFHAYIYDLSLKLYDKKENNAVLIADILDFDSIYVDRFVATDTLTAELLNIGTEELVVNAVEGNDHFDGIVPEEHVTFGNSLPVKLVFSADEKKNYTGDVVIKTNAGDYTVSCLGKGVSLPYDYSAIIAMGDFSFNTSKVNPFKVEADSTYNANTGVNNLQGDLWAWLEASFDVPEGNQGVLAWEGHNSSAPFLVMYGDSVLTSGSLITLDGTFSKQYAGTDVDASSSTFPAEQLILGPGRHMVRFAYLKKDGKIYGDDRLMIRNLSLTLNTAGINQSNITEKRITATESYSADGVRQSRLSRGLNIIRTIYADGTSSVMKVMN